MTPVCISGNPQELCGDESTIVVIQNPPIGTYSNSFSTLTSLDFRFDGCVHSHLVDPSTFYRFRLNSTANQHPHHCLQLCAKYKQKYALISSDRCVCSSLPLDTGPNNITRVDDAHCSQRCAANYFYSCGHPTDALIYAKYFMRVDCRPGTAHRWCFAYEHRQLSLLCRFRSNAQSTAMYAKFAFDHGEVALSCSRSMRCYGCQISSSGRYSGATREFTRIENCIYCVQNLCRYLRVQLRRRCRILLGQSNVRHARCKQSRAFRAPKVSNAISDCRSKLPGSRVYPNIECQ